MSQISQADIVVVGFARTAIGSFGGALKDVPNAQLATTAVRAALQRSGADPAAVGHVVMGTVIPTEPRDAYLGRIAALDAGCPKETCGAACGSGRASDFAGVFIVTGCR